MSLNNLFTGVLDSTEVAAVTLSNFIICMGTALILGLFIAIAYTYKNRYSKSFVVTLATLPAVVAVIIMMVNGNLGTGVAVAGTFSLVRFRSIPGTAKEIGAIFLAMGTGLATGMGYIGYAIAFTIIVNGVGLLYTASDFGEGKKTQRLMKITIPEDLDYTTVFNDLFVEYTDNAELISIKTSNMGSLFKLTYDLVLIDVKKEKEFMDALRCRNANLEITVAKPSSFANEL
ncbi:DUF4956 domain-containing protein [Jeotgalibaca sp. MA1X17-3]|uniref:DUF4956 domain-containing protein n=1 Tax=Jeotgalibaca sp. MA1X17-3 TaxID=2908211 RepID=UPI001F25E6CA|nr:DUF4956 domain-containing protein [Jeotgalibaca sp. MA1X17-3]UJF16260.1 DUF4956 domain-containing protein [Jeotgalibaca sp. MA1X17-3]